MKVPIYVVTVSTGDDCTWDNYAPNRVGFYRDLAEANKVKALYLKEAEQFDRGVRVSVNPILGEVKGFTAKLPNRETAELDASFNEQQHLEKIRNLAQLFRYRS